MNVGCVLDESTYQVVGNTPRHGTLVCTLRAGYICWRRTAIETDARDKAAIIEISVSAFALPAAVDNCATVGNAGVLAVTDALILHREGLHIVCPIYTQPAHAHLLRRGIRARVSKVITDSRLIAHGQVLRCCRAFGRACVLSHWRLCNGVHVAHTACILVVITREASQSHLPCMGASMGSQTPHLLLVLSGETTPPSQPASISTGAKVEVCVVEQYRYALASLTATVVLTVPEFQPGSARLLSHTPQPTTLEIPVFSSACGSGTMLTWIQNLLINFAAS